MTPTPNGGFAPELSVVVPTCDTRELTLACLASVRREDAACQIILVDDGGSDDTLDAAQRAGLVDRPLRRESSGGFTVAANAGLAQAAGTLLLVLNSDTELRPGALTALRAAFASDPRLGVVGARLLYPDGRPQWSGGSEPSWAWLFALASGLGAATARWRRGPSRRMAEREAPSLVRVDWVTGAAMAMRTETWLAAGPFDPRFQFYAQDLDLCHRAAARGWGVAVARDFVVEHHQGATISRRVPRLSSRDAKQNNPTGERAAVQRLDLLWTDLLAWCSLTRGARWAWIARWILVTGGLFRLGALSFDPRRRRREQRHALRAAVVETFRWAPGSTSPLSAGVNG